MIANFQQRERKETKKQIKLFFQFGILFSRFEKKFFLKKIFGFLSCTKL